TRRNTRIPMRPWVMGGEPMGEALPNQEIFRRLAGAMGYAEPALYESDSSMLDEMCRQAGLSGGFVSLKTSGTVNPFTQPVMQFADGKFPTASGKIEIASAKAEAM